MTIRSIALSAMAVTFSLCAADLSVAPLAVYYSFDTPPSAALVTEMESEVGRILAVAGMRVAWRDIASPRNGEDFQAIVVFRFRGICSFAEYGGPIQPEEQPAGQPLAETDIADGRVLPFGSVDCDRLKRFIEPVVSSLGQEEKNVRLGRAVARVSAHEIYHMLTGSEEHARRGIARAKHNREELTAPTFAFGREETNWLRAWTAANLAGQRAVATVGVGMGRDEAAPLAASPAGR
jgi:hypothetical protein